MPIYFKISLLFLIRKKKVNPKKAEENSIRDYFCLHFNSITCMIVSIFLLEKVNKIILVLTNFFLLTNLYLSFLYF